MPSSETNAGLSNCGPVLQQATGLSHVADHWRRGCSRWITVLGVCLALVLSAAPQGVCSESIAPKYRRVLFLGNSITLHGPSKAVDWSGNWGMAASAAEKDFVHLITNALAVPNGAAPKIMVENIATFERQYATHDLSGMLKKYREFNADLVVVAIGENVPPLKTDEAAAQFEDSLTKLLKGLETDGDPAIVVRSCFWANKAKDKALKAACEEVDGIFVDIGKLGKDESNYARSERKYSHKGVAAHPGDRGMKAIADAILRATSR